MKLPNQFVERMKEQLKEQYEAFERTYEMPTHVGLRVNTLKISVEAFLALFPYKLEPIPWTRDGFYYEEGDAVTKHPLYYAGLYYIQEPSAMSPVTILKPEKGELVLDLCAAPGGKSVQIAAETGDQGLLVTNDINDKRVKAIVRNVEKYGIKNVVVLNDNQHAIADVLSGYFDKILIDAPCSGEGMFKKDAKAVKAWESYANEVCAKMQFEILAELDRLSKDGTEIVYSTCTFSPMENEDQVNQFIRSRQSEYVKVDLNSNFFDTEDGFAHLWPHQLKGEGHFIAKLKSISTHTTLPENGRVTSVQLEDSKSDIKSKMKKGSKGSSKKQEAPNKRMGEITVEPPQAFREFEETYMNTRLKGPFMIEGEKLYKLPQELPNLTGLRVARVGWLVGDLKRGRFTPSQAFAMGLRKESFNNCIDLSSDSPQALKFLKGETLIMDDLSLGEPPQNGFCLVCTDGFPLGFVKVENRILKNLYPVSWRMMG